MIIDSDEFMRDLSLSYWAEEEEMKAGIHPTQIIERMNVELRKMNINPDNIGRLDYNVYPMVEVHYKNGDLLGTFDYQRNVFI